MKQKPFYSAIFILALGLAGLSSGQDQSIRYLQAGNTFYTGKNYDQAIRYYEAATELSPRMWQAFQGLGNCYYAKGDKTKVLPCYQKSLSLNPDNPSLSALIQALRDEEKTSQPAPNNTHSAEEIEKYDRKRTGFIHDQFELSPGIGPALYSPDIGLGFGLAGFYMIDSEFGFGGMVHFYAFANTYRYPFQYTTQGLGSGRGTEKVDESLTSLQIAPAMKYRFGGKRLRPYFILGGGLAFVSGSSTTSYSFDDGPPLSASRGYSSKNSGTFLMGEGRLGLELSIGEDLSVFAETGFDLILSRGSRALFLPLEMGLTFKL